MADKEGTRQDAQFMVISLVPDVCKSPTVPVPYPIVGYFNNSIRTSPNVRFRGVPAFHMQSRVATVIGDEAGIGGGVNSNTFKGMCKPIIPVPTVRVNKQMINHHQLTLMWMNCLGPEGQGNTIGSVKFIGLMMSGPVGPGGTVPSNSNPPANAESIAEGGCMPKLDALGGLGGGLENIVGLAKQAYSLATTDWSNPSAVLGTIGGVAGMAGMGNVAQAAQATQLGYSLATADWSNPGAAMGAAMGIASPMIASSSSGKSAPNPSFPNTKDLGGSGGWKEGKTRLPPGVIMCGTSSG
ncbi:MAG: DUF4150 domain-containing protein [Pirellulales bacterium]|nr:DUF4150 domain-containing protein [Pirellulales bacterium]